MTPLDVGSIPTTFLILFSTIKDDPVLIVERQLGEGIIVNEVTTIYIHSIKGGSVRLSCDDPKEVSRIRRIEAPRTSEERIQLNPNEAVSKADDMESVGTSKD